MLTQDRIDRDATTWRNTTVAEQAFRKAVIDGNGSDHL